MNECSQLVVRTIANGATAQLRSVVDTADREEARRIHAELKRIACQLAMKHDFDGNTSVIIATTTLKFD